MNFSTITPEDIISPAIRDQEKPGRWHLHISTHSTYACVTGVSGDDLPEAEDRALNLFLTKYFREHEDQGYDDVFGNRRLTYCGTPDCGGCDLEVHLSLIHI